VTEAIAIDLPRKRRITLVSTGGTIEKTYDELRGILENRVSVLDVMLDSLQLEGVEIIRESLMNKDSLEMSTEDHAFIADRICDLMPQCDGIVVTHGTDRLAQSGEAIYQRLSESACGLGKPVVLIGAMRPYVMRTTDAMQNLTEALLAVQLLPGGVYCVMHNQVLSFPGVRKDTVRMTFSKP
jgi:L-asparaginase